MDKPLLRLNHPRVQRFFFGMPAGISVERCLLHILSSGSIVLYGSDKLSVSVDAKKSIQGADFWIKRKWKETPYSHTNFDWGILYG